MIWFFVLALLCIPGPTNLLLLFISLENQNKNKWILAAIPALIYFITVHIYQWVLLQMTNWILFKQDLKIILAIYTIYLSYKIWANRYKEFNAHEKSISKADIALATFLNPKAAILTVVLPTNIAITPWSIYIALTAFLTSYVWLSMGDFLMGSKSLLNHTRIKIISAVLLLGFSLFLLIERFQYS